jgi:acetyl esterase/lipase
MRMTLSGRSSGGFQMAIGDVCRAACAKRSGMVAIRSDVATIAGTASMCGAITAIRRLRPSLKSAGSMMPMAFGSAVAHSPRAYLDRPGLPPMFIARAGKDQIAGVNDSIDAFVAEALRRNVPVELMNHPDGRHGFDYLDDLPRTREIIERTIAFLKTQLAKN